MSKEVPTIQQEKLNLLQTHVLNTTHKCFQACVPRTNNIIFSTYTFAGEEPLVTVIIQCPKCKQLTYLLYTLDNCNIPIYRENFISIPFINSFFKNYSPDKFDITIPFYQHLISTLNNYYMHLLIKQKRKPEYYVSITSILRYCQKHALLTQPISFLQNMLYSDNTKKNRETLFAILSLSRKQLQKINTLAREKY